jgi:signal transduction histidine kinase
MAMAEMSAGESNVGVLIFAPIGRDGPLMLQAIGDAGLQGEICDHIEDVARRIREGAGLLVLTNEALTPQAIAVISKEISEQPPWSDFPILILTNGTSGSDSHRMLSPEIEGLANLTLLERPVHKVTLIHAVQAALRARRRQYEIRDHLIERQRMEEELRRSNEDLRQFAYAAGHDLKEPLRTVGSYMQLLQRKYAGKLDKEADDFLNLGVDGVARMNRLISDLLAYAQLGTQEGSRQMVNAGDVLLWTRMNLAPAIQEAAAEITSDPLPSVYSDQMQLLQLFQNLIGNALKYRSAEPPRVHVSAEKVDSEWVISVRDNGIGFDPQYSDRIFGVFKRLHGRDVPGTGIGLALCKRIMEKHGGRIWAESEPGKGSVFFMAFPVVEQNTSAAAT